MSYCDKCGAYIPIGETACPACGYDPEEEARRAREAEERAAAEEKRRREEAEAEAKRKAQAEAKRKAQAESWAAQERKREEEARRRAEQSKRWQQDPRRQQGYSGGASQSQYASQRTGRSSAGQGQYASQRTGSSQQWAPPWTETQNHGGSGRGSAGSQSQKYADMRDRAADSAANQSLSILSYLGPLFLIPLLTRRDDDFARYHANQGLNLFLVFLASSILGRSLFGLVGFAGAVFTVYGAIKGIGNVLRGKKEPLPLIGNWKIIK